VRGGAGAGAGAAGAGAGAGFNCMNSTQKEWNNL